MNLIFLLSLITLTSAISYSSPIQRAGSLRAKLLKNGKYPEFLAAQKKLRAATSQPFLDYSDDYYRVKMELGTPPQAFTVSLDTASSFLWVLDVNCKSKDCKGDHYEKDTYNNSDSTTFQCGAGTFVAQFDGQPVTGYLAKETFTLANSLNIRNQDFGSAQTVPDLYLEQPVDGVLGFGLPAMAVNGTKTPLDTLMPLLDLKLFTIWMDKITPKSMAGNAGLITYGALDSVNCDSKINYVPLNVMGYWGFALDGFAIGTFTRQRKEQVISDTASGWIGAPPTVISTIVKATGAKFDWNLELYTVPCSQMTTQPDLIFTINGINYPVKSVEYILDLGLDSRQCALTFFGMSASSFGPAWVLGDTFIRSYCHVYDYGNMRIGLAKAHSSV
ncbi:hypothetical protein CRE_11371 [Caenorhabditis remanei]|uniref:Peptidase A1 domain-containing protein n=1 Tax=Caenorhabditis remanei TaxID=31234 RepID=E3N0K6_CAERE|nr:hypothetical protein CRE_11371 [Caenorhabditis remanei]